MSSSRTVCSGVVRGRTIELAADSGLLDGQEVTVTIEPLTEHLPAGEGLRRSFGAWAGEGEALDAYLKELRRHRSLERDNSAR